MGASIRYQCTNCKTLYDNEAEAAGCSEGYGIPSDTKYLAIKGPYDVLGFLDVMSVGRGCDQTVYVKPARGFKFTVPSVYHIVPGWGSRRQLRIRKGDRRTDGLEVATREVVQQAQRQYNHEIKRLEDQIRMFQRFTKYANRLLKEFPENG